LFDIQSANVLRGPQGTGAFRNASAGAIKSYSNKPSGEFGATGTVDYGNYNRIDIQSALEFPIVQDTLSGRVAFRMNRRGGIMKNRCNNLPPYEDRPVRIPGQNAKKPVSAGGWSYCGESVPNPSATSPGVSEVEPNQPSRLNQQENFAARGVLLFQPELPGDFETEWLFVASGSRIDQPSTVGQAYGTRGVQVKPGSGEPPVIGRLGAETAQGYIDADVTRFRNIEVEKQLEACSPNCTRGDRVAAFAFADEATAKSIGRDLDSDPYTGAFSHTGTTRNETMGFSLKGDTDFGDIIHLRTVLAYDRWKRHVDVDLDFTSDTAFETETNDRGKQVFADVQVSGTLFEDIRSEWAGPLDWEIGGFTLNEELDVRGDVNFGQLSGLGGAPRTRVYTQTVDSRGGYGHLSWEFLESFTLDGGVRFNWERRGIDYKLFRSGPALEQNEQFTGQEPTGTVRLTYAPTENISVYGKYTRGWKSGTFNATGSNFQGVTDAKPETVDAFEVGTNQSYFEGMLELYVSFFHYSYQQYQLFTSQSGFLAPPTFVILNAQDVELYGSEIEAKVEPWEGGLVDMKVAWLEGSFLEFVQTEVTSIQDGLGAVIVQTARDNSGNRLLNAPQFTVNLTAQQTIPVGDAGYLTARWDGAWKDDVYFDASEGRGVPNVDGVQFLPTSTIGQKSYWLHNVRLSYRTAEGGFEIAGWIRNVADRSYKTFSADLNNFQSTTLHFVGDPRTYGMTFGFKF
jgi:outer membrane receptor protein involved in Fe transport